MPAGRAQRVCWNSAFPLSDAAEPSAAGSGHLLAIQEVTGSAEQVPYSGHTPRPGLRPAHEIQGQGKDLPFHFSVYYEIASLQEGMLHQNST